MSHAEIWDDSALVNSWNEAVEEYRHYHSIHARGEKVEEVLKTFDSGLHKSTSQNDPSSEDRDRILNGSKGGENMDISAESTTEVQSVGPQSEYILTQAAKSPTLIQGGGGAQARPSPLLQHFIGSVHDEGLKSLLMSWYYAGYYTGLYEGQHQGK